MEVPTKGAHASAEVQLSQMGYKSELPRNLSMMSILGLCVRKLLCGGGVTAGWSVRADGMMTGRLPLWVRAGRLLCADV